MHGTTEPLKAPARPDPTRLTRSRSSSIRRRMSLRENDSSRPRFLGDVPLDDSQWISIGSTGQWAEGSVKRGIKLGPKYHAGQSLGLKELRSEMVSSTYSLGESSLASAASMISGGMILLVLQLSRICNVQRISKAQSDAVRVQV